MPERDAMPLACARPIGETRHSTNAAWRTYDGRNELKKSSRNSEFRFRTPAAPVANYVPFVRTGYLLFVSGQLCLDAEGKLVAKGKLGGGVSVEDGQKAARACAINVLAQVKAALGDLDKVKRVVRLGGFINSRSGLFSMDPKVMNGASDLMVAVFGDKGRHARTTVGVAVLPGRRRGRGRRHVRGRLTLPRMPGLDWLTARPVAHRGLHDDGKRIIENTPSAFRRRDRGRLRHRMRSADQRATAKRWCTTTTRWAD